MRFPYLGKTITDINQEQTPDCAITHFVTRSRAIILTQPLGGTHGLRHPSTCISLHAARLRLGTSSHQSDCWTTAAFMPRSWACTRPILGGDDLPGCQTYKVMMSSLPRVSIMSRYPFSCRLRTPKFRYSFSRFPRFLSYFFGSLVVSSVRLTVQHYFFFSPSLLTICALHPIHRRTISLVEVQHLQTLDP